MPPQARSILLALEIACTKLQGDQERVWSVTVSGNWRITFRFTDGNGHDVDLMDYH
jgi:plasmid maintenance system killer protein